MDCSNKDSNIDGCNCDYDPCPRKGLCCQCLAYHRKDKQLPACLRDEVSGGFEYK